MTDKRPNPPKTMQVIRAERVEQGYVALPYNEEQFRGFIKSLLGSPQTISKIINGSFEIEPNDIRNLYQLILQRVTQQNEGVLAQFSAKIVFSDDSSVELNSIEELLTYNEVRPIYSRNVHLDRNFVVKFQDKQVHEKQRIQVSFVSSALARESIDKEFAPPGVERILFVLGGYVSFRIEHTARTWGADIEALLTNHINSLIKQPPRVKGFLKKHDGIISFAAGTFFFIAAIIGGFLSAQKFSLEQVTAINTLDVIRNNVILKAC